MTLPFLVKKTNTYISITKEYMSPKLLRIKQHPNKGKPLNKQDVVKRNSRIIKIGHAVEWKTFVTLTFDHKYLWDDYEIIQDQFRSFTKHLYYKKIRFKYLAVLEHGGKYGRIHYHMLTDIEYTNKRVFEKFRHSKRKVCPLWKYGFSDVVKVRNDKCNAVFYMAKYLTKYNVFKKNRTPIGKREVFSSRGLNKVEKFITYDLLDINCLLNGYKFYAKFGKSAIFIKKHKKNDI